MLSRRDRNQPPRHFEPSASQHGSKTACRQCKELVFNSELLRLLDANQAKNTQVSRHYSVVASDIYASIFGGCPWCTSIGNALLTAADLDYWMNDWLGSDGQSTSDNDGESPGSTGDSKSSEKSVDISSQGSGGGTPGFVTLEALQCPVELDITIDFVSRGSNYILDMVDVAISARQEKETPNKLLPDTHEEPVRIIFEVKSTDLPPTMIRQSWAATSAASRDWVEEARKWLQICHDHVTCKHEDKFQPTRLIDLRNLPHLKLATCRGAVDACRYVALSYVWGSHQSFVLKEETHSQMHAEFDMGALPQTIKDAILVAKELEFDYLWVDALCIIQDSEEDKLRELPQMARIYQKSSMTIVAASASSAKDEFLHKPKAPTFFVDPFCININAEGGIATSLEFGYRETYKTGMDPINSRAWTLQERTLSPRMLIFSGSGVMWMCKESHFNPAAPPDTGPPYQTALPDKTGDEAFDEEHIREKWMAIRADFTEMDLTYCRDKLPAISALAAEVQRRTSWIYLAGIWKENLFSELHWTSVKILPGGDYFSVKPKKARDAGYIAPSWSWASSGLGMITDSEDECMQREVFDFEILDCQVMNVGGAGFSFGPVESGFLLVKGKLIELFMRPQGWRDPDGSDVTLFSADHHGSEQARGVGHATMDPMNEELKPETKVLCLAMSKRRVGGQHPVPVEGLLLAPIASSSAFRRIGFFQVTAPSVFDKACAKTVRIE